MTDTNPMTAPTLELRRYTPTAVYHMGSVFAGMERDADGGYVRIDDYAALQSRAEAAEVEAARLNAVVNTPQADDFLRAVSTEAEHQRQRWGSDHDAGKAPEDWFWLIGYLAGKALHCHKYALDDKAEHHVITTAAACANWHLAMRGKTNMRPGIDGDAAIAKEAQ